RIAEVGRGRGVAAEQSLRRRRAGRGAEVGRLLVLAGHVRLERRLRRVARVRLRAEDLVADDAGRAVRPLHRLQRQQAAGGRRVRAAAGHDLDRLAVGVALAALAADADQPVAGLLVNVAGSALVRALDRAVAPGDDHVVEA